MAVVSTSLKNILLEDPFRNLNESDKKEFISRWKSLTLSANQDLKEVTKDESPIVFVENGRLQVKIRVNTSDLLVRSLTDGNYYGFSELALGVLKKNSYVADETSDIFFLGQNEFLEFFESSAKKKQIWEKFCQDIRLRDELRVHPYFRKLGKQEIFELSHLLIKQTIPKNKVLIKEGSKSSSLFFIQSGRFKVTKSSWAADYSSFVESGSVLGEMGVLEKKVRNATVTAIQESVVYELLAKDAEVFFKKSESLYSTLRSVLETRKLNQEEDEEDEGLFHTDDDLSEDIIHFLPSATFSPKKRLFGAFPVILQESADETASACRRMLLTHWGYEKVIESSDSKFPVYDSEVTMESWKETFSAIGQVFVLDKLKHRKELYNHLFIVRWESNKFILVLKFAPGQIKIVDPANGIRTISESEWDSKSGKHAIVFVPKIKPIKNYLPSLNYFPGLFAFFKPNLSYLLSGILATFLIKVLEISLPLVTLYLIDNVLLREIKEFFVPVLVGVIILSFSQILFSYLRNNVLFYTASKVNQTIIVRFLEKLLSLPISFFESHTKGEILQRWEEIEGVTHFFSEHGTIRILDWIFGIIVFILFFFLSPSLLTVILLFIVPELILVSQISPLIERETKKESLRTAETLSYFIETINGNETVKNLGAVSVQRWDFEKRLTAQLNAESKRKYYSSILESSSMIFRLLTNITILLIGTYQILSEQITLGTLFAIIGLITYVRSPMVSIVREGASYQRAKLAWRRLTDWDKLDSESSPDARFSRVEIPDINGSIVLKEVSFEYKIGKREFGLSRLSLELESGKNYAFVGRSGSGKSTILKLLLGLHERSGGEILIDGISLDEIWMPSYRTRIGVVYQENPVILGTVRENIALSRPESTLSEIVEAAKLAYLHDQILNLPLGYDTELSENGVMLSGGQKQKLAIARVFLQKPSLIILDEPTAAMDRESEEKVLANLHRVFQDKTIVVVAHRLETIRKYDKIFVLENGELAESGTHRELISKNGIYHLLHSKQEAIR
ncbi:MAG: peptidase domain-containing ABC transporter [Leptospira sp.]|nr:peptidase domain-containing ABC transporter [Leptospira sp.]